MEKYTVENDSAWETDQERASRQGTTEKVQAKKLIQLSTKHPARPQSPAAISSTLATRTRASFLDNEAFPPLLPLTPSTAPQPVIPHNWHPLKPNPNPPLPAPPTKAQTLAFLSSELDRRQNTRQQIERQLDTYLQEMSTHPSKQVNTEQQRSRRLAELLKPEHDKEPRNFNAQLRKKAKTAEEAEAQEMRDIQSEYEGGSVAPPARKTVDAFFAIIADTERQLKRADEMGKVVRERERELDEELYRAHCAVFEMEDEIEEVENGVDGGDAREG